MKPAVPLQIAVIGAGLIGERHARLVHALNGVELVGIVDPSPDSRDLAQGLMTKHFATYEEFLARTEACDGVIVATPNHTHREIAQAFIERDVACLIEKPLAANEVDAQAIADAARAKGISVAVGHHRRFHQASHELKKMVETGKLGQVVGAQLCWMLRKPDDYFDQGVWRKKAGGGPVWINLIHEIDLLRYFLGEIVEVSALLSSRVRGNPLEDSGVVNLRFENGAVATAIFSDTAPSPWHFEGASGENPNIARTGRDALRVFGSHASVSFPSLETWSHSDEEGHWGTEIACERPDILRDMDGETALRAQLENFAAVIRGEAEPLVSAFDGLQSVRVVEAIHRSAINEKSEKLG